MTEALLLEWCLQQGARVALTTRFHLELRPGAPIFKPTSSPRMPDLVSFLRTHMRHLGPGSHGTPRAHPRQPGPGRGWVGDYGQGSQSLARI